MRSNRLLWLSLAVLVLGVVPGCSEDDDDRDDAGTSVDAGADAGTGGAPDASTPVDAGTDAGTPEDAGTDAGTPVDAGSDAGADAGTPEDAGTDAGADSGTSEDAGVDAGTSEDAGTDAGPDECSGGNADAGDTDAGTGGEQDAGDTDAGTGGEQDAGPVTFPDGGTDPRTSPAGMCPAGAALCERFGCGLNGWEPSAENATIVAENRQLHIVTEDGHDERTGGGQAIARWTKPIMPVFGTQLFVRAHVYMQSLPPVPGQMGTFFVLANLSNDFGSIELQVMSDSGFALDDWSFRVGQGWNRQHPVTLGMAAGRWVCLEWEIRRPLATSTHGNARVYVDGALAHDFMDIGMRDFNSFHVGYGFVHPLGPSGSETFIDNVVVSSTRRIGCQ
ncbi:MSCRAMM family adhesin SdrC [Pyxidicoccus xibeiensis]|uniref:MSCRAMM family adhesin SdrC n=1 Tax=Pyxidicoccus xibeiensis TaxID=2906759 RepID=UPI0020A75C66|nr:MSCRAMM family adhesin SdrC [Pyxidicoccus xibeiensis]MCP3141463.1 MSCRAMM family adhesin SdrC [Pyxidicoccus xibeiensis]